MFESSLYNSIDVNVCFGVALIVIFIKYITTKRIKSFESNIFFFNFILNIIIVFLNITYKVIYHYYGFSQLLDTLGRINVFIDGMYLMNLALYLFAIVSKENFENNKIKKIMFFVVPYVVYIINAIIFLPGEMITYYNTTETMLLYTQDGPVTYTSFLPIIEVVGALIDVYTRYWKKSNREFKISVVCITFALAIGAGALIFLSKEMAITTLMLCFVTIAIFFTNESINIKLIDLINKNKDEAESANKAQEDFLSTVSHDIRTPMNVIMGYSEAISTNDNISSKEIKKDVENISLACDELNNIVNRILSVSKIASGSINVSEDNYNILDLIKIVSKDIEHDVSQARINFKIDINPGIPYQFYGDSEKIKTIIELIVRNIIRNKSNTVDVKFDGLLKEDKMDLIIRINHTGSFFTKEEFNTDFNTYLSEISKDKDSFKSDFLGVLIAKEYINILNGSIKYEENINTWYEISLEQKITNPEIIRDTELYKNSKRGDK